MKKLLFLTATVTLLAACNNKEKEMQAARQATLDSVNTANNHQRMLDSMTAMSNPNQDAMVIESPTLQTNSPEPGGTKNTSPKKTTSTPTTRTPPVATGTTAAPAGTTATDPNSTAGTGTATGTEEKKKKGLNNAAKGAIIGLGTGAAAGAVINKENRGKGAVIGGVIGAVGGAVGGAVIDKRKAKKEAADTTDKK